MVEGAILTYVISNSRFERFSQKLRVCTVCRDGKLDRDTVAAVRCNVSDGDVDDAVAAVREGDALEMGLDVQEECVADPVGRLVEIGFRHVAERHL